MALRVFAKHFNVTESSICMMRDTKMMLGRLDENPAADRQTKTQPDRPNPTAEVASACSREFM